MEMRGRERVDRMEDTNLQLQTQAKELRNHIKVEN